jgi:hypothetical protein
MIVDFDLLLSVDGGLADADAMWRGNGDARAGGRLYRCRDGRYTARLVWRNRAEIISTITYTVRGLVLA